MMARIKDLSGQKFNMLTVISYYGNTEDHKAVWLCRCDCGVEKPIAAAKLKQGQKSCGCLSATANTRKKSYHGKRGTGAYVSWSRMIQRCNYDGYDGTARYKGRGVSVCERWRTFVNFLEDMGDRPEGCSLDRINNEGDYEPSNCRRADQKTQARNKSTTKTYEYRGQKKILDDWADEFGINRNTLTDRVSTLGWGITEAIERPIQARDNAHRIFGEDLTLSQASKKYSVVYRTLASLVNTRGYSAESAVSRLVSLKLRQMGPEAKP